MSMSFEEYDPGQFSNTANTGLGRRLWAFLSADETVRDMELASELGHPAVVATEERLLEEFGADVLDDRTKQMIGHMVRQIMEKRGYVIDQSNVTISSVPFTKGTRYRRPTWYMVYVFRNSADPRDICFSRARTGATLPDVGKDKWRYASSFATKLRAAVAYDVEDFDALRAELEQHGYKRVRLERLLRGGGA